MPPEEFAALIKRLKKVPLYQAAGRATAVSLDRQAVKGLLPHRDPFLLVDEIDGFDPATMTVRGRRHVRADDPVFTGHFPGQPVYPGVLQVEAMGQLGLCLSRLLADPSAAGGPPAVRATHIHHATFLAPVGPGDTLELHAGIVDDSGLTAISAGQVFLDGVLCACAVQEVYFVD